MARHLAFIPVGNAGINDIASFQFSCGASLELGRPETIWNILPAFESKHDLSASEAQHFQLARAWLWLESDEEPAPIDERENVFFITARLARQLWTLRWCIDLSGCGENKYWRNGANMHCAGVYVHSVDAGMIPVQRRWYIYAIPVTQEMNAPWSTERLQLADTLFEAARSYAGKPIARLTLATDLRTVMTTLDARRMSTRFQLAVTALETLFVAPSEHLYLWDPVARRRIYAVAGEARADADTFFESMRARRHDAVHRAGLDRGTGERPRVFDVEIRTERILRESLRWAILNQSLVAEPFEEDEWPQVGGEEAGAP